MESSFPSPATDALTGSGKTRVTLVRRQRARIAQLEKTLAAVNQELEATTQGVLALYAGLDEAQAELIEKNRQIQEADRLKGEFLANMSHEIRTPMNAIMGLTEALLGESLSLSENESLCLIREASQGLLALINDILDFSKIEAGMLGLELVDFAPARLFDACVQLLRGLAQQKQLTLSLRVAAEVPTRLRGDRHRLRQVVLNLVGNAIKFSERGEIVIQVTADGAEGITVTVQDSGPGISLPAVAKLFQPFVQENGSITRRHGGTGLGLSICRRLVELMGGRIWVESVLGEGSTFGFWVPLEASSEPHVVPPPAVTGPTRPGPVGRVLVAEDHRANQLVARYQLEKLGMQVDFVNNGREAVAAVRSGDYQLVLMDCHMPEMCGYEATREIRRVELGAGKRIPIIAMTAGALSADRDRCLEAGMDDYVSKPVEAVTLARVLSNWLGQGPNTNWLIDFARLEHIYGPGHGLELGRLFQSDAGAELERLLRSVGQRDLAGVEKHGHGLRGLCGTIGLTGMAWRCELLRQAQACQDWPIIEDCARLLRANFDQVCCQLEVADYGV